MASRNRILGSFGLIPETPTKNKRFYIIWNPQGYTNPTTKFTKKSDARAAAKRMAQNHSGSTFFIAECQESFVTNTVTNEVLI